MRTVLILMILALCGQRSWSVETTPVPQGEAAIAAWSAVIEKRGRLTFPRVVVTPYYAWYVGQDRWGTVAPETMTNLLGGKASRIWDRPLLGCYRSDSREIMAAHCAWAKSAGIDVFAVSFAGRFNKDLLTEAVRAGIQIAPYLEFVTGTTSNGQPVDFLGYARNMAQQAAEVPGALWCIDGKPVIFAYKRTLDETATPAFWAETLLRLKAEGLEFVILGDISPAATQPEMKRKAETWMQIFDGLHSYHVLFQMVNNPTGEMVLQRCRNLYSEELRILRERKRISCLTVMPGWDNRTKSTPGMVVDRRDGAIYEGMWQAALEGGGPDLVMATSFNEWFEGGTIEPSSTTGTRYLELTRRYSARFRGMPEQDRQVKLARNEKNLQLIVTSNRSVINAPLTMYASPSKTDAAIDLVACVKAAGGVVMMSDEANESEPERISINGGARARSSARNPWYAGTQWNGASGDWYYRFDGTPRIEAVFGTHHVVVFLNGEKTALADGKEVTLAFPATDAANGGKPAEGPILVPLSLLTVHLGIPVRDPIVTKAAPIRPPAVTRTLLQADERLQKEWHPRLVSRISALIATRKEVKLPMRGGKPLMVVEVTETGISATSHENSLTLSWRGITAEQRADMLMGASDDTDLEGLLISAVYLAAGGKQTKAEQCLAKAAVLDQAAAKALRERMTPPSP